MAGAADSIDGLAVDPPHHLSLPVSGHRAWAAAMSNLGMVPLGMNAQQLIPDSMCIQRYDPGLGLMSPMPPLMSLVPPPAPPDSMTLTKEIIHCQSCTLFPQNPSLPPPSTRERPPGCKTVFVGGLPENATEETVREVFSPCGEIIAIRKSKKNFCHIRYSEEFMVDKALYLSGFRMRLGSSTDKKDSGRIHVDFAQARDDLYEWECRQRQRDREHRHILSTRPVSPQPVVHYSDQEGALLAEGLKDDHAFCEATSVLLTWMERGEVNRRTANHFYSMIQSANSHVRRLLGEKAASEGDMERAKEVFKNSLMAILNQFEQICGVFTAASRQKAWDHFSKAQRKNIDIWRKQCEELRAAHSEEVMGIRREEEMEMSEEEEEEEKPSKRPRTDNGSCDQTHASLKEENDSLRWQLEAYRNEVELLRRERGSRMEDEHTHTHTFNMAHTHTPEAHTHTHTPETHTHPLNGIHTLNNVHTHTPEAHTLNNLHTHALNGTHTPEAHTHPLNGIHTHPLNGIHIHNPEAHTHSVSNIHTQAHILNGTHTHTPEGHTHTLNMAHAHTHNQNGTNTHTHTAEAQIQLLQQSMHAMQQQLLSLQEKLSSKESELDQTREEVKVLREKLNSDSVEAANGETHEKVNGCGVTSLFLVRDRRSDVMMRGGVTSEREALLLGIMSTFLHVHPFGANLEYLWSYIQRLDPKVSAGELECLMVRLPSMFRQTLSGVGANLEKRWTFCGFDCLGAANT